MEIEARFLNVDVPALVARLHELEAEDRGENLLSETIFYDEALAWERSGRTLVRVRQSRDGVFVAYKDTADDTATGTHEVEFAVDDRDAAEKFLALVGLVAFRRQEKKRHAFRLNGARIDIDTWPGLPPYVEIEGPTEDLLRETVSMLGLDWGRAEFGNAGLTIEKHYGIPTRKLRVFTFDLVE